MPSAAWPARARRSAAGPARARDPWTVPAILLGLVACLSGLPLCIRCFLPAEIDYNEGWNAFRQVSAAVPGALYGRMPDLAITNYPPLSFHIVGALAALGADPVLAGRILSLLAIAVIGVVLARVARRLAGSGALAACAMLGWVVGLEFWTPERIGVDDPQLLGMAFEAVAFDLFLQSAGRTRRLVFSACLVAVGLFIKHSVLALPLGMTLALVAQRSWRALAIWIGAGGVVGSVATALTLAHDGHLFFAHLLQPRLFIPERTIQLSLVYALNSAPALAMIGVWAWWERRSGRVRPLVLAWLAALAEIGVFAGGDGVGKSIFQDAIMLTALLQPLALQGLMARVSAGPAGRRAAPLVPMPLLLAPLVVAAQTGAVWAQVTTAAREVPDVTRAEALLRGVRGPVACEDLLLCFRAGRTSAFDAYYVLDQRELGRMKANRVDDMVRHRRLAAVEIGNVEDPDIAPRIGFRLAPSFIDTLEKNYRPRFRARYLTIYEPR